ncbi:MAG: thiamine phosphate synthase [Bacteroides sp.]
MKLIVITTPYFFFGEEKIITNLFNEGLEILHLRKPNADPIAYEHLLSLIPKQYHQKIVVHEHFFLQAKYGLKGIHLNARNKDIPANYSAQISCSCHSIKEVQEKKEICDYVFLSPIFDSISKENYPSGYSSEILRQAVRNGIIDNKVMALGGIDSSNMQQIKDYSFGGAVVLGDLWNKLDFPDRLLQHFKLLQKEALLTRG